MKKKIFCLLTAATVLLGALPAAFADTDDNSPAVYVDDEYVQFEDQKAVIMNDFTMVPVRGVFNAMGAKVDWDGETQTVTVNSRNNMIRVQLTIGSDIMTVYHFVDIMSAEKTEVTLEAPPVVVNDNETYRTLIPLRAISEGLDSDVVWNGEEFAVYITTPDIEKIENKATLSLSSDIAEVNADDVFSLYIDLKNLATYPNKAVSGVTASVEYDKENFTFLNAQLCNADGEVVNGDMGADNPDYSDNSLKTVHITINTDSMAKTDGHVMKLNFQAKSSETGTFALVNRYNTQIGHDMTLLLENTETRSTEELMGNQLAIDTTPVIINAKTEE